LYLAPPRSEERKRRNTEKEKSDTEKERDKQRPESIDTWYQSVYGQCPSERRGFVKSESTAVCAQISARVSQGAS